MHISFVPNNTPQIKSTAEEIRLMEKKETIFMKMHKN